MALIFSGLEWKHYWQDVNREQLIVYRVNGHGAMEWIDHGKAYFFSDSVLLTDSERIRFHIRPNRIASGVGEVRVNDSISLIAMKDMRYFAFKNTKVLVLDKQKSEVPQHVIADYLIISNNAVSSLDKIQGVRFKQLILDSSNSLKYSARIVAEAKSKNVLIHSVLMQGAFHTNL